MSNTLIKDRLVRKCSICGRQINVVRYQDHSYRGGHHFGGMSRGSKKKLPIDQEYWECPKCYWGGK